MTEPVGRLLSLHRYPVKSMLGEDLDASEVTEHGLVGDRAHALVDPETGQVCSAKRHDLWGRLFEFRAAFADRPRAGEPYPPVRITFPDGSACTSDDPALPEALGEVFGRQVAFSSSAPPEATMEEIWPDVKGDETYGETTGSHDGERVIEIPASFASPGDFFDFSAIHLLTTNSLEELARREPGSRFGVRRFRPNLVVEVPGETGFVENDWDRKIVSVGDEVRLKVILPTPRCVMTTLAQEDLPRDPGVLRATAEHNRIRAGGLGTLPCVGVYAAVLAGGTIRAGDPVRVEEDVRD